MRSILVVAVLTLATACADPPADPPALTVRILDGVSGDELDIETFDLDDLDEVRFGYVADHQPTTDPTAWVRAEAAVFTTHEGGWFRLERNGHRYDVSSDDRTRVRLPRAIEWGDGQVEVVTHDRTVVFAFETMPPREVRERALASLVLLLLDARAPFAEVPRHTWIIPALVRYAEVLAFHYKTYTQCFEAGESICLDFFAACWAKCRSCTCQPKCSCFSILGFFSSCDLQLSVVADQCNVPSQPQPPQGN